MMKKITPIVLVCVVTLAGWFVLCDNADAQARRGRGGMGRQMSPEQMEQFRQERETRMLERMREDLGFTAEEWTLVSPLLEKVMELDRQLSAPRGPMRGDRRMGRRSMGDRPMGDRPMGDRPMGDRPMGDRPMGDRPMGGDRSRPTDDSKLGKARQALQTVVDDKAASAEQIKTAMKTYRDELAKVESQRKAARAALREVLDSRQEAKLVLMGLLD